MQFHQYRAPLPPRSARQFTHLRMPLSRAFQRLVEGGLIASLPPRPPLQPTPPGFRTNLHCVYHQRAGHDTDNCSELRHAIHDLIDQGLVDLVQLLERSFKERTTRFYASCTLRSLTYPFGAYWPHLAHIEMH